MTDKELVMTLLDKLTLKYVELQNLQNQQSELDKKFIQIRAEIEALKAVNIMISRDAKEVRDD